MPKRGDNDHELISRALEGSGDAFRIIIEKHHAMAYSAVRSILQSKEDAEDCLQNVYVKIYTGLGSFRGASKLSTWIYRVARNEAINMSKRNRRENVRMENINPEGGPGNNSEDESDRIEKRLMLDAALGELDDDQRSAVKLCYMGELSYREAAGIMEVPVGTVKTHIYRAKLKLKRIMMRSAAGRSSR